MTESDDLDNILERSPRPHRILEKKVGDKVVHAIHFTTAPFRDIIFTYGKVDLVPIEDENGEEHLNVKFEYDILQEPDELYVTDNLERELGDFLLLMIAQQLKDNELIYSGGTDENRGPNLSEPDVEREVLSEGYTVPESNILLGED